MDDITPEKLLAKLAETAPVIAEPVVATSETPFKTGGHALGSKGTTTHAKMLKAKAARKAAKKSRRKNR